MFFQCAVSASTHCRFATPSKLTSWRVLDRLEGKIYTLWQNIRENTWNTYLKSISASHGEAYETLKITLLYYAQFLGTQKNSNSSLGNASKPHAIINVTWENILYISKYLTIYSPTYNGFNRFSGTNRVFFTNKMF